MSLLATLQLQMTDAQRAKDAERLSIVRLLLAALQTREIEKRGKGSKDPLTEEESLDVLRKEAKKRKEAIALYVQGNRKDLAAKEDAELAYIAQYLPAEAGEEEITRIVRETIATGAVEFAAVMKQVMAALKGRADGRAVGDIIRKELAK